MKEDIRGSGTSANVYFQIFGKLGQTNRVVLDSDKTNFQRASTDIFGTLLLLLQLL